MPSRRARLLAGSSLLLVAALLGGAVTVADRSGAREITLLPAEIRLQLQLAQQVTAACNDVLRFSEALVGFGQRFWEEAGAVRSASLVASVGWQASEGALVDAVECWEGRGCVPDRFFADAVGAVSTALRADDVFRRRWAPVSDGFEQADGAARSAYETFKRLEQEHPHVLAQSLQQLREAIWSSAQQRVLRAAQRQLYSE